MLPRDLGDFLIDLSIALHKHSLYPDGHPSLAPAAESVARRAGLLLESRNTISLGVARHQLVIEGVASDPKHPVVRELAGRLHRHHLGAITFRRGVQAGEVVAVLEMLAVEAERVGEPLGLGPPERLRAWEHVQLHPLTYERLELVDEGAPAGAPGDARVAGLWVGLARAAMAMGPDSEEAPPTEPVVIAHAIDEHSQGDAAAGYDQVIVGYLLQIAEQLKKTGGPEALGLRRRTSRLLRSLKPDTLRRLVEMGGDFMQRRRFALDATDGMTVDSVLEILKAAAEASQQELSHSLVRMLSKLAAHAETGAPEVRAQADSALREQVRGLLAGWSLPDPNPGAYGAALDRMARAAPIFAVAQDAGYSAEPDRVVAMALEVESVGPRALLAVDRMVEDGRLGQVLDALDQLPTTHAAAGVVWERIVTEDIVRRVVTAEPVDFKVLERLVPRLPPALSVPLLEALAAAESRGTRRGLLGQLARMGSAIGPIIVGRLDDERWYVVRNLIALLDELRSLPEGFSPARFTLHPDARVRWQAIKLQLKLPVERDAALLAALKDRDPRTVRLALGLGVALQQWPDAAVPLLVGHATDRSHTTDLRVLAIRALGYTAAPAALEALLRLTTGGRTLFGKRRLPFKSPQLLVALTALATGWSADPRAQERLARATASRDPEVRAAAARTWPRP
ncbi:MAG TPA: hypothetical protein VEK78_12100 [Gemmatimonadales bacterium]|nr:hypothetical protein [Gemmatimonadales bacterium]